MQLQEGKAFSKCIASSFERFFSSRLFSCELLSALKDLKSIPIALKLRAQWVAIRRNLKHTQEVPKVNISLDRCGIAEPTECFCDCSESER